MKEDDKIAELIRDVAPSVAIEPAQYEQSLVKLGIDSLDHASILLQVEEHFGIKIPDGAAEELTSVAAISRYVAASKAQA
jgi:acyl carrier protein